VEALGEACGEIPDYAAPTWGRPATRYRPSGPVLWWLFVVRAAQGRYALAAGAAGSGWGRGRGSAPPSACSPWWPPMRAVGSGSGKRSRKRSAVALSPSSLRSPVCSASMSRRSFRK